MTSPLLKKISLFFLFALLFLNCKSQNNIDYNFGFESNIHNSKLSDGWFSWGNNTSQSSSEIFQSGKKSVLVQSEEMNTQGGIAYVLFNKYKGKEITLEGYIKTEKTDHTGLFITFGESEENILQSKDVKTQTLQGTSDWKKYMVSLPFNSNSGKIVIGGFLKGKGKVWFDNFKVYIDGKNVEEIFPNDLSQSPDEFFVDSQFRIDSLNNRQITNLYQLGKTWGYIKYHSPFISKGEINWDYELFRFLPNINSNNFNCLLYSWSTSFGSGLKTFNKENHYIDFVPGEGNPVFKNEESYPRMKWDDGGMKLLSLFRYWNCINYFFPYKDLIGKNWDNVLKEYIPKLIHTNDELTYKLAVLELTKEINDSHAGIYTFGDIVDEFYGFNTAPIATRLIDGQLAITYIDTKKTSANLSIGDIITEIDHKKISDLLKEKAKYIPASNNSSLLRYVNDYILKTNNDFTTFSLKKANGTTATISINTVPNETFLEENTIPVYKEIDQNIGYIYPAVITENEMQTVMKKFKNKKGIIIDLRCYPKAFTTSVISEYFFPEAKEFAQIKATSLQYPGTFKITEQARIGKKNTHYYQGKVAILVDEYTQSASEFLAMALQTAPQSAVIGSQTAGTDGDVSSIDLPGSMSTSISGLGISYPNGKHSQRAGVSIDIQAQPTLESLRKGEDPLVQKAVEFINR
ncbi:S41 family peptidase [Chryseobacterium sp. JK1]|uniref:S41 family peptidase n=1 Tax=Chryseobacterium sp. JK1 TaxID=874294 RepID=UPI003D680BBA